LDFGYNYSLVLVGMVLRSPVTRSCISTQRSPRSQFGSVWYSGQCCCTLYALQFTNLSTLEICCWR